MMSPGDETHFAIHRDGETRAGSVLPLEMTETITDKMCEATAFTTGHEAARNRDL